LLAVPALVPLEPQWIHADDDEVPVLLRANFRTQNVGRPIVRMQTW
jgi:hypothetical protein